MDPTEADINNLRAAFFKKLQEDGLLEGDFHPADINRIKASDDWLKRFLIHQENNQSEALKMMIETCQWRKAFGVNDISEENLNSAILKEGSVFSHGRDRDGKALLIFKSKLHVKDKYDFVELQRVLVYWMERLERQENGEPISIFFDMGSAGLSNMDTEYTKYIINLFKCYYPNFLNNIYVFEMAWVLSAVFKLIKSWLPPRAVQKIKTVNKSNLKDFVAPEQSLLCWGGLDDYVYEFIPEARTEVERKKVHFADRSPTSGDNRTFSDAVSPSPVPGHKLTVVPSDVIGFVSEGGETSAYVRLTNDDACLMYYKIKTTSPEKFRVRPSAGQLTPGGSVTISVQLQPGYDGIQRDKFMIMAVSITPDAATVEPAELWKNSSNVIQHKLRCSLPSTTTEVTKNGPVSDNDRQFLKLSHEVSKLHSEFRDVADEIRRIQIQQWVLILLVGLLTALVVYLIKQDPVVLSSVGDSCEPPPLP